MICAVLSDGPQPYLAGIFSSSHEMTAFLGQVPATLRPHLRTQVLPHRELPCFAIEEGRELRIVDADQLAHTLQGWEAGAQRRDGEIFGNVYWLPTSWTPPRPGTDYMGAIVHVHVDTGLIDAFVQGGLRRFLAAWLDEDSVELAIGAGR